ncbi:MAG: MFS transporter [Candidatus Riflebacteria bacterium]|nr:MFS transporter [Candidatus Riflebacteria bacterium]
METTEQTPDISLWETLQILFGASRAFWLVNLVNFCDGIAYFGMLTLLTRFLGTKLGMSDQLTSVSVSAYTGMVTLFMFGGGFVSDKLGVRRALTFSLMIMFLGRLVLTLSPMVPGESFSHDIAWFGLFLMAFGSGVVQPALYAGTKEYTDPRTATIGYGILYAIMNLGIVAENFLSPFVRTGDAFITVGSTTIMGLNRGIEGVFWMCVGITAFMLISNILFFTKSVEDTCRVVSEETSKASESQKSEKNSRLEHRADEASTAAAKVVEPTAQTWKEKILELPFLDVRFMFFIFILLPVRTLFAHQFLTMPDYVFRCFPAEVSGKFEWISGINPLIIVVFVPLIAALTRNVGVVTMMILGTTLSAVTTFILVPGPTFSSLIWYTILFSFGEALWSSRFLEYVANIAPAGKVGAYMGLAGIPWFLAKFTTGLYSGSMLNWFIPAPLDLNGIFEFLGVPKFLSDFVAGGTVESTINSVLQVQGMTHHNSGTLWMIYGVIACISPIGLIIGKRWIEAQSVSK